MLQRLLFPGLLLTALADGAMAADETNVSVGLTAAGAPLALHGADPVAAQAGNTAVPGAAAHTVVHDGAAYNLASAKIAAIFAADPAAYLPQNGGFCTFGVSVGKKFDGDPAFADIRDGKLYVFLNAEVFEAYRQDPAGTIAKAAARWPQIRSTPAAEL